MRYSSLFETDGSDTKLKLLEANRTAVANWMLALSIFPPALVLFLILFGSLIDYVSANLDTNLRYRDGSNLLALMIFLLWMFSVLIGCAVLIIDCVLIIKRVVSLRQGRIILSLILATLDAAIPVGILVLIANAFKDFHMWP